MKFGYVAVLGLPNAGKSSLVNYLVGEEVAIVSHRKQTTRNSILGIKNGKDFQIVFVDTPGIHHSKNNLDKFMNKNVRNAIAGADVVLYLFDGSKDMGEEEIAYIENMKNKCENVILVETKADKKVVKSPFDALSISVVNGKNLDKLLEKIVKMLPVGKPLYDEDTYTDKSVAFLICEKVRGILLDSLDKEIPHGVAVVVSSFKEYEDMAKIELDIICERDQHKGIIIGKGGQNLKNLGQKTREFAEDLLGKKCVLKLFVKVDKDWREHDISTYGYQ